MASFTGLENKDVETNHPQESNTSVTDSIHDYQTF